MATTPVSAQFDFITSEEDSSFVVKDRIIHEKTKIIKDYLDSLGLNLSWDGHSGEHIRITRGGETVLQFFAYNFTIMDVVVDEEKNVILNIPSFFYNCNNKGAYIDLIVKKELYLEQKFNSLCLMIKPTGELYFESVKLSGEKIVYDDL